MRISHAFLLIGACAALSSSSLFAGPTYSVICPAYTRYSGRQEPVSSYTCSGILAACGGASPGAALPSACGAAGTARQPVRAAVAPYVAPPRPLMAPGADQPTPPSPDSSADADTQRQQEAAEARQRAELQARAKEALTEMKGIRDALDTDGKPGENNPLDLKSPDAGGAGELKAPSDTDASSAASRNTQPASGVEFGDPNVVDARSVPSGLPKFVEDSIPRTPAGDCARKGFEATQTGDWKVALAWFQTGLEKEPGNPELQRLVDLAQFTFKKRSDEHRLPFESNSTPSDSHSAVRRPALPSDPLLEAIEAFPAFNVMAQSIDTQAKGSEVSGSQKAAAPDWPAFDKWVHDNAHP